MTDVQAFFTKWLVDLDDAQRADGQFPMVGPVKVAGDDGGPAWADAGVICPWTIYEVYGDRRVLERHYAAMSRFIAFCKNRCTPELLPPKFSLLRRLAEHPGRHAQGPICTAYFAYSTKLTAQAAEVLGKTDDAARYRGAVCRHQGAFKKPLSSPTGGSRATRRPVTCWPWRWDAGRRQARRAAQ